MKKFSILLFANLFLGFDTAFAEDVWNYEVTATKLEKSRNNLSPKTGGSSFSFEQKDIDNLPQGQATPLNQVLLRAPSVVANSQNQIHVRGDHANLQYRINGVMLPEGVNGFGQNLDTHFAEKIDFLTGAMPAQYGLRTAGVIDIKTKTGNFPKRNRSEITIGGNDTLGANQQIGGNKGNLDYYLSASYLQNSRGIESTTAARNSNHNDTSQDNVFGYFSYILDASKRVSLIVSNATNRFQIPNNPNQEAAYDLSGATADSNFLNQKQKEASRFAIASLQGISDLNVDYQISAFTRYSDLQFNPDYKGDLIFNGIASTLDRSSFANGLQSDFGYELDQKNTLRYGFYLSNDQVKSASENWVFEQDGSGGYLTTPFRIDEQSDKNSQLYSAYLQNEWKALEDLTLNYGGRFDMSRAYVNEWQLSPRFGAVYDLSKATKIHAGYARYFTPPPTSAISETTRAKFANTSNASESEENSKVKAERTNYFDLGISHKANEHLTLALDGYYKQIKNLLDEHQFGNSLIYTPFNYQRGKAYGLEFKADYQKDNFAAYLNLATQRAYGKNINSGQYIHDAEELEYISKHYVALDHVQNYTASFGSSYNLYGTKIAADALFGSGLRTGNNNSNTMPSYIILNASVARDFLLPAAGKINLRLSAVNLEDKVYQYSDGSGIGVSASQYAMRRTFFLIASKNF
ncbi:MAG: TonB-dependent receptor [Rickettsiales bacterium]|nr:TonB-dependent receptor [Rickettsiales bacterium]